MGGLTNPYGHCTHTGEAMHRWSTTRAAGICLVGLVLGGSAGCANCRKALDDLFPAPKPGGQSGSSCPSGPPKVEILSRSDGDACGPGGASCAKPGCVEVRESPPVHVKIPQQTVVVESPPAPPQAPVAPQAPMMPQMPMAPTAPATSVSVNHVPAFRSRMGFTFDTIRVPLPIIRPIAIPTVPEYTYTVPAQPVVPAYYPQPVAPVAPVAVAPVQPVQPVAPVVPQQYVQVAPVAPPVPTPPASPETVEEYCRQVDALIRALEASKAAAGCK